MNTSINEKQEIDNASKPISHSGKTSKRSIKYTRVLKPALITALSVLCLSGGIVLHKIHAQEAATHSSKKYSNYAPNTSLSILKEKTITPFKPTFQNTSTSLSSLPETQTIQQTIVQPDVNLNENSQETSATVHQTTPTPINEVTTPNDQIVELKNNTEQQTFLEGFTLKDALRFKENFLAENPCLIDYQKLLNVPNKTTQALAVLNDLSPYCLHNQKPVQNILDAFLKNKKEAIIEFHAKNNPAWLAYLKSIPVSLIEIRRINPTKNTEKNILYKAQNELLSQNVENAVNLVTQLPLYMQQKMNDFYREASIYNRALYNIDQLILSFERKGE